MPAVQTRLLYAGTQDNPDDCKHMCHPSAYQVWLYHLVVALRASLHRLPAPALAVERELA